MKCTAKLVKPKKCKLQTKILLGLPGSHLLVFKSTNTNMDKIFETNSCFLVKERTAGKVQLRFFRRYLLVLKKKCLFWRKTIILWSLEIFLIFLNFLRTYFFFLCGQSLLRPPPPPPPPPPTPSGVRQLMRQLVHTMLITNSRASFHLW